MDKDPEIKVLHITKNNVHNSLKLFVELRKQDFAVANHFNLGDDLIIELVNMHLYKEQRDTTEQARELLKD